MQYNARDVLYPALSPGSNPNQFAEWLFSTTEYYERLGLSVLESGHTDLHPRGLFNDDY